MVAMVLICLVVVSVIQLSSANLRNLASSDNRIETLQRANEKMREVLEGNLSEEKTWQETDDDGYAFNIAVAENLNERSNDLSVKFMEVTLDTRYDKDKGAKTVTLRTAKTVSRAENLKSKP